MDSLRIVQKNCYLEQGRKAVVMKRTRTLPQNINVCNRVAVLVIDIL